MDLEHHGFSVETAGNLMRAARVGRADIIARPAKGEFMRMGRLLEQGAHAIMYPRCDGPDEASEVARWARFAPDGTRGFDGAGADSEYLGIPFQKYLEHTRKETVLILQIEHQQALDQAEAIAAIPGVDLIMLGPADFTILEGFPCDFNHPRLQKAIETIAIAARNAGKHWACTTSFELAPTMFNLGARLFFSNADIVIVRRGLELTKTQFASLGFTFESNGTKHALSFLSE